MTILDFAGTFLQQDRADRQLWTLDVPVDTELPGLVVELSYDHADGAVLDLGLRSPAAHCGWSGGARSRIVVSPGWATPGYVPCPIEPGRWQVLLGLHRLAPAGTAYRVTVRPATADDVAQGRAAQPSDPPGAGRPPRRELPAEPGRIWLAADFHTHTVHSDGALSVSQLAALAVERGLDVLAVTDHNTTSHHAHLAWASRRYGIRLVPGQEITTDKGHANAFGAIGFVDFTTPADGWARTVADQGGIFSVNHPLAGDCAWRHRLVEPSRIAEIWHSSWNALTTWGAPIAWWLAWSADTVPIGDSDFHHHGADGLPGAPTTWVACADPDGSDVLEAVAAGFTAVAASPDAAVLLRVGGDLVAVAAEGLQLASPEPRRHLVTRPVQRFSGSDFAREPGPWWLEDAQLAVHALTR